MPEMPEVQGLVDFLDERLDGLAVESLELASFSVLKTFDPPPQALAGAPVDGVHRHGKFIDVDCDGIHLVVHLARAGWIRWSDELPRTVLRPGKSPIALRVRLVDGSGFDVTEAGTKKSLAAYLVRDVQDVPGIARLGPDPLAEDFTRDVFAALLAGRTTQIKGVLRDHMGVDRDALDQRVFPGSAAEAQPFYVSSPFGIVLAHTMLAVPIVMMIVGSALKSHDCPRKTEIEDMKDRQARKDGKIARGLFIVGVDPAPQGTAAARTDFSALGNGGKKRNERCIHARDEHGLPS